MEDILAQIKEIFINAWNGPSRYVIIVMGLFILCWIPATIIMQSKRKKKAAHYHSEHPDAAEVMMISGVKGHLTVLTVNGSAPNYFYKGTKLGFYLLPGENVVNVQYTWTRPGVLYRTVTTTVKPCDITLTTLARRRYQLDYSKKKEIYTFEEAGEVASD